MTFWYVLHSNVAQHQQKQAVQGRCCTVFWMSPDLRHLVVYVWRYRVVKVFRGYILAFVIDDRLHGKNHRSTIFVIPPKRYSKQSYSCFDFKGADDVGKLWVERVELFFRVLLYMGSGCSLWSSSSQFLVPFQSPRGYQGANTESRLQYVLWSCTKILDAVPVRNITGRSLSCLVSLGRLLL